MNTRKIYVNCRMTRGSFSGEAVFRIDTVRGEYVGIAPRRDFRTPDGKPVDEGQLPNEDVQGLLVARLISNGGDDARIALPDGEVVTVSVGLVTERESEIAHHVPV